LINNGFGFFVCVIAARNSMTTEPHRVRNVTSVTSVTLNAVFLTLTAQIFESNRAHQPRGPPAAKRKNRCFTGSKPLGPQGDLFSDQNADPFTQLGFENLAKRVAREFIDDEHILRLFVACDQSSHLIND
jgi:hypothetical protein